MWEEDGKLVAEIARFSCVCVCSDGSKVFVFTFFALVKTQKFKTRCFNFRCVSQFKKEKKSKCHKHGKK